MNVKFNEVGSTKIICFDHGIDGFQFALLFSKRIRLMFLENTAYGRVNIKGNLRVIRRP